MTARTKIAGYVREVGAAYQAHPEPRPSIVTDTWTDLAKEIDHALEVGADFRAVSLARQWREECLEALTPGLLNSPLGEAA